jgi:pyridoxal phosphate enzyme (YggS family)
VLGRIAAACSRAGRPAEAVQLVAVSKTIPADRLRLAILAGHACFGENRVQEASDKVEQLGAVEWHLVGHLQSNKAARAVALFDVIESVDSLELATRLDRLVAAAGSTRARPEGAPLGVYLQVNVDADPAKSGFEVADLERQLEALLALRYLDIRGLMTVGWLTAGGPGARRTFERLRERSARLRARDPRLAAGLSMGMSDDYEVAVEEGATVVRVGRALFGERPSAA